ncbi:hypothetical protein E5288_WYG008343 [Bos mutus]|uniref:Uncharacterized protein n=1 Tax=Bos mutus TaxID=72004 RepID=A0A6B0SC64_9CETA|nr:hypothetical protein [Bos mutus]
MYVLLCSLSDNKALVLNLVNNLNSGRKGDPDWKLSSSRERPLDGGLSIDKRVFQSASDLQRQFEVSQSTFHLHWFCFKELSMLLLFLAELNETDTFDPEDDGEIQFKDPAEVAAYNKKGNKELDLDLDHKCDWKSQLQVRFHFHVSELLECLSQ